MGSILSLGRLIDQKYAANIAYIKNNENINSSKEFCTLEEVHDFIRKEIETQMTHCSQISKIEISKVQVQNEEIKYKAEDLSVLSYANGFTLWHYKTQATKENILSPGFFNPAFNMLRVKDMILLNGVDYDGILVVSKNDGLDISVLDLN